MGFSDKVFTTVAEMLLDEGSDKSDQLLSNFDDLVAALSIDSGLTKEVVQSRLVERMLQDSRHLSVDENVNFLHEIFQSGGEREPP